ncbi:MAG: 50S ribosomal protein L4 [Parcubacteria group bacterium]|nr:50S ribosomal protein L4 [Parcubacteria group bacterium]
MNVKTYNQKGEDSGEAKLPKGIFDIEINEDLMHQVVVSQMSNKRQGTAHAKDRSEVRGGGRKPWQQKGTGRARHGSTRSPIWKGGGVTFGPRNEKNYKKIVPKKIRRKALLMALSSKVTNNQLIILDELKFTAHKTKQMVNVLKNLPCYEKKTLIALPEMDIDIIRSARNIQNVETIQVKDINVLDILNFQYLVMPKTAVKVLEGVFKSEKKEKNEEEKKVEKKEIKKVK